MKKDIQLDLELARLLKDIPENIYERLLDSIKGEMPVEDVLRDFKRKLRSYRRKHNLP